MESTTDIMLFVPNIIGYFRILFWIIACFYMRTHYTIAFISYIISTLLDAFDGHAARALNQSTKFGAMLDMLLDRVATMTLVGCLCGFYPKYTFWFQMSMALDIASHWLHVHVSIAGGSKSHKSIDLEANPILRVYYTNKIVLFCMCAANELFYSALYLCYFTRGPFSVFYVLATVCCPLAVAKSFISLLQLFAASVNLAAIDVKERSSSHKE